MKMLVGQAVLMVLVSSVAVVVKDFTKTCPQFFATPNGKTTPPTVFIGSQYKEICHKQASQNVYEFASHYDSKNRIPMYSAYVFVGRQPCKRKNDLYIEPQIDDQNKGTDMASESSVSKPATHQALNGDYKGSGYHKRHLYPVFHTNTQSCADSTFTLTNAAPQHPSFNMGEWKSMENGLEKLLDKDCLPNKAFVVTGVVPSLNPAQFTTNGRVNVPIHFWNVVSTTMTSPSFQEGISPVTIKTQGNLLPALLLWIRI